jgi:hypothetical protein
MDRSVSATTSRSQNVIASPTSLITARHNFLSTAEFAERKTLALLMLAGGGIGDLHLDPGNPLSRWITQFHTAVLKSKRIEEE